MEGFQTCPICLEIPEDNIYQCSAGHIICNLCIPKVPANLCPQCRISFGLSKIRSRVLEEILDPIEYPCKFKSLGCEQLLKRWQIKRHAEACFHNPNLTPLCEKMGYQNCNFMLGSASRAQIISHFGTVHNCPLKLKPRILEVPGKLLMEQFRLRNKQRVPGGASVPTETPCLSYNILYSLITPDEMGPLFLIFVKVNRITDSLSLLCIRVWHPEFHGSFRYRAKLQLLRSTPQSTRIVVNEDGSQAQLNNVINPFPLTWELMVYNVKEVIPLLNASLVNISISLLEQSRFGDKARDRLLIKISLA
ncbi:unnamed protein product [Orchesella dallaii]|uniref:RING-type E3 ubiquitin transferase n=1 Tax=Orchesella dallaii TaxID=48710 RepID=A0ABP1QD25_9HEXA